MKHIGRLNVILWGSLFLATCLQAVWEHGFQEVDPFTSFMYLVAAFAMSLAALAGEEK
jgi:hypothetical protein